MMISKLKAMFLRSKLGKKYRVKRVLFKYVFQYRLKNKDIEEVEQDTLKRAAVLERHMAMHRQKAAEINLIIDKIFAALGVKNDKEMRQDMLFCYFAYGFTPNEYMCYQLERKTAAERGEFISDRESVIYANRINDIEARQLFMDKMRTYNRYKEYYKREAVCVETSADYENFLSFISRHPMFVKKNVFESCGRSVELVDSSSRKGREKELFDSFIQEGKVILEEKVCQSKALSALNSSSVNTVRCFTLNTRSGVIVPWCFFRTGKEGSFVDNGGAGGIFLGLDCGSGMINTDGVDENGQRFDRHPNSGITFIGFQLPEWESMIAICKEMAAMEPEVKWIGWDMAHTENGWVAIEGNALSEAIGPQCTSLSGIRNQMDHYLKNVDFWME